ncbi:ROK family transcriptional regulator [Jiangella asiatica]|uniref:ROK family transcriptional regulator n=1 Tax=Jiangella asiatica TaxID=2530372 RepID=A0A4R5CRE9_9ACTN|nr:ROK family transcriptional regulator [Jiangella asiatica]TDE00213.1 ROK family transcriptional regulator [Jiangella asiatica]
MSARHVRVHNRAALLRLLREVGPLPRIELADRSGLSATTVTKAIAELISEGVVAEIPRVRPALSRVGRPSIDVALVAGARHVCGVQVGVGTVQLAICDLLANVVEDATVTFDPAADVHTVLGVIETALGDLLTGSGVPRESIIGIGIGAPGPVDAAQRRNLLSINLGWRDVPFSDHIERALGIPTVVDHNVRAMALAEARYGLGREADSLAFVYLRTGVGAGLVLGRQPYRGGTHGATEIGHLRIGAGDRPCSCGSTGCLETVASEPALVERVRATVNAQPAGLLASELAGGRSPLAALVAAGQAGDPAAGEIIESTAGHLATGLANLINLLNPELIVVGGFFCDAGDLLLEPLRRALRRQAFPVLRDAIRVELTTFGPKVGVVGAAAVALDRVFYRPPVDAGGQVPAPHRLAGASWQTALRTPTMSRSIDE